MKNSTADDAPLTLPERRVLDAIMAEQDRQIAELRQLLLQTIARLEAAGLDTSRFHAGSLPLDFKK